MIDFDEETRYRKKSVKRPPKKSTHKHVFKPCVFETKGIVFDKAHGIVKGPNEYKMGSYCEICGKVGPADRKWWCVGNSRFLLGQYTEEAERQLDPATRTLPTFYLEDYFQKFVILD